MEFVKKPKICYGGESFHGRVLKVNVSSKSKSFETPTKAPTTTEINAKQNVSFDGPFLNPIFEITQRFNNEESVRSLHRKNGVFARRMREINAHAESFKDRSIVKFYPQIADDVTLSDRDMLSLIDLQIDSHLPIISLPEPSKNCSSDVFYNNFLKYWEYVYNRDPEATLMPYLNINQHHYLFRAKLKQLLEHEGALHTIGIKFASINEFRPNLMDLAELGKTEFWVHCSSVKRFPGWQAPNAQLHALQRFNIDTVSIEIPQGRGGGTKHYNTARYFDSNNMLIPPVKEIVDSEGNLSCDCPVCSNQNINDLASQLRPYVTKDRSLRTNMNDLFKVHEVYASTKEFELSRDNIKNDELTEYFKNKAGLKPYYKGEENQSRLF